LHGLIIGRGGNTLRQINNETKTRITITRGNPVITISGVKIGVEMAKKRIEDIIESSIFKLPPTHFISLPLADTNLQRKVEIFKSDVLNLNIQGIDESLFIRPPSLHITIGMLHLYRNEDTEGAVKLLKSLSTEINDLIGNRTLVSILTGLAVMEPDPVKAHVLYTKVEEQNERDTLKKLGEYLIEKFADVGYLKKENRPLKLHVTLMKTRHRDNGYSTSSNNYRYRDQSYRYPFNAVSVLNKFSSTEFGSNRIESIHISKIGEYDECGRHHSEGCIKLP
jgi:activating signal cointegrator complex subunit 1